MNLNTPSTQMLDVSREGYPKKLKSLFTNMDQPLIPMMRKKDFCKKKTKKFVL